MTHSTRQRALAATAMLVAGLGTLTACGDGGGSTASGSNGATAPSTTTPTVTPSPSSASTQGLPEGFPTEQVPLVDEKVVNAVKGSPGGAFAWSVVMTSQKSVEELSAQVAKDYADAGYRTQQHTDMGDVSIHRYSNGTYQVGVTIARTGDGITVTYLVKDKA